MIVSWKTQTIIKKNLCTWPLEVSDVQCEGFFLLGIAGADYIRFSETQCYPENEGNTWCFHGFLDACGWASSSFDSELTETCNTCSETAQRWNAFFHLPLRCSLVTGHTLTKNDWLNPMLNSWIHSAPLLSFHSVDISCLHRSKGSTLLLLQLDSIPHHWVPSACLVITAMQALTTLHPQFQTATSTVGAWNIAICYTNSPMSKTCGCKSDDKITKLIIELQPRVSNAKYMYAWA